MNQTPDLDAALTFVVGRLEEQAALSGRPLTEEQRLLLNDLPPARPAIWYAGPIPPPLVPRDLNYEQLRALAKAVYLRDHQINPPSLEWEFAFAVCTLKRHSMSGLLHSAGMKQFKPWWDAPLLIVGAFLYIAAVMALMFFEGNGPWTRFQWLEVGSGCVAATLAMHFASRRIEDYQLRKHIEKCRVASHVFNGGSSLTSVAR